jgi:hypothetical protein
MTKKGRQICMDELDRNIIGLFPPTRGFRWRPSAPVEGRAVDDPARLERLETSGVIAGHTLKPGEAAREGRLRARSPDHRTPLAGRRPARLRSIAEIERVFTTSGRFDFLVQVACPNTQVLDWCWTRSAR